MVCADCLSMMVKGLMFLDDLLLRNHQIQTLRKPSKRLHRGLFNYVFNRHPVTPKDERFIFQKDDFVMLTRNSEFSWLDDLFQRFIVCYDRSNLLKVRHSCLHASTQKSSLNSSLLIFSFSLTKHSVSVSLQKTAIVQKTPTSITFRAAVSARS